MIKDVIIEDKAATIIYTKTLMGDICREYKEVVSVHFGEILKEMLVNREDKKEIISFLENDVENFNQIIKWLREI